MGTGRKPKNKTKMQKEEFSRRNCSQDIMVRRNRQMRQVTLIISSKEISGDAETEADTRRVE
jgi:hypothetical protein